MSRNAAILAEARKRVRQSFPNGGDPESAYQIPVLVKGLDKLQEALAPFARIAVAEAETAKVVGESHLVSCRLSDCVKALKLLQSMEAPDRKPENFGSPA